MMIRVSQELLDDATIGLLNLIARQIALALRHAQAQAQIDEWRTEFYGYAVPPHMRPSFDPSPFRPPPRRWWQR